MTRRAQRGRGTQSSALLIERRLAPLIGHRKRGVRHLFANLKNHGCAASLVF
jgi:hypothetical protein